MRIANSLFLTNRCGLRHILFSILLFACVIPTSSHAKYVALVIGNDQYPTAPLINPSNDARAIGTLFRRMGYDEVDIVENAGTAAMATALDNFSNKAASADVAVIYYAGHGVQIDGKNYAIPLDVSLDHPRDVRKLTGQQEFTEEVARAKRFGLVILDACRDNPFNMRVAASRNRSTASRGLARERDSAFNTVVAYATASDDVAADGAGLNSPYTTALLENIENPNFDIFQLFGIVRDSVIKKTDGAQQPYLYGSLGGERYYLHPKGFDRLSELDQWQLAKATNTLAGYEGFLNAFPNGNFADNAKQEIQAMAKMQTIPITIGDLQYVSSSFESLRSQFQQQKWGSLVSSAVSEIGREKVERIKNNKTRFTYVIENVRARKATQTVYADILVQNQSDGAEFEIIPISANRGRDGVWSAVAW